MGFGNLESLYWFKLIFNRRQDEWLENEASWNDVEQMHLVEAEVNDGQRHGGSEVRVDLVVSWISMLLSGKNCHLVLVFSASEVSQNPLDFNTHFLSKQSLSWHHRGKEKESEEERERKRKQYNFQVLENTVSLKGQYLHRSLHTTHIYMCSRARILSLRMQPCLFFARVLAWI